jgi:hypothetical protein
MVGFGEVQSLHTLETHSGLGDLLDLLVLCRSASHLALISRRLALLVKLQQANLFPIKYPSNDLTHCRYKCF